MSSFRRRSLVDQNARKGQYEVKFSVAKTCEQGEIIDGVSSILIYSLYNPTSLF